jgi:Cu(I)/Ag(I) efflux system membrane fusion protein
LISGIKTGSTISFEFVERKPGEWVITAIKPGVSGKASAPGNSHAGH